MVKAPPTPKGFRDILPEQALRKREVIAKIAGTLEQFDFQSIETPIVEFADTILGKYGDEADRLVYVFEDRGGRKLALRYDLTVPLARFVASNLNLIVKGPFRRYQIGEVFRGENPQKGRFREFTQFDFDIVGSMDPEEDAKVIAAALKSAREVGLKEAMMLINDRQNFSDIPIGVIRAIDKMAKIGKEGVEKEIIDGGISQSDCQMYLSKIQDSRPTENLRQIFQILTDKYSLKEGMDFIFDATLARGLDYYTGAIFEMKVSQNQTDLSIGAGGRYDNLIGIFAKSKIPAVGFAFGIDRLLEVMP